MVGEHMGRLAGRAWPVSRRARLPARARRQRRPTGEPPPPRPVAITAAAWLVLAAVLAVAFVVRSAGCRLMSGRGPGWCASWRSSGRRG